MLDLIAAARRWARAERTTLDAEFRLWLADYAGRKHRSDSAVATIHELQSEMATGGRQFTRDEMNER